MLSEPQGLVRPEGLGKLKKMHLSHRVSNSRLMYLNSRHIVACALLYTASLSTVFLLSVRFRTFEAIIVVLWGCVPLGRVLERREGVANRRAVMPTNIARK
jgi:hypothetical protein